MNTFTGKVALVTGAAAGIGYAVAERLAQEGASVVLSGRNEANTVAAAERITASGGDAIGIRLDVSDQASVEAGITHIGERFGRLDLAVNNAGLATEPTPLHELSVEDFDHTLAVDLRGVFLSMRCEIPLMLDSGGGAIVNVSSGAGLKNAPGMADYTAAKHGVIGLTKNAALQYARQNIRVNAVAPGTIATPGILNAPEDLRSQWADLIPMGRMGRPEEVADCVAWLTSDRSTFVTGAVVTIDGGFLYS
ncbi:SDR family NAD(P)-dependent oxidoreductase [Promicromonospora sp. NFX87]|uniref:SDR family NAD(P)-dependent oxidoreductase n=1 Tax=Promicromonospora sp. NFX87 TaxID=3402691 RepID=UPI003AFA23C8